MEHLSGIWFSIFSGIFAAFAGFFGKVTFDSEVIDSISTLLDFKVRNFIESFLFEVFINNSGHLNLHNFTMHVMVLCHKIAHMFGLCLRIFNLFLSFDVFLQQGLDWAKSRKNWRFWFLKLLSNFTKVLNNKVIEQVAHWESYIVKERQTLIWTPKNDKKK